MTCKRSTVKCDGCGDTVAVTVSREVGRSALRALSARAARAIGWRVDAMTGDARCEVCEATK